MNQPTNDDFRETFFQECEELLEALNDGLIDLMSDAPDPETIHAIFRSVHSIKGGAAAFGLSALVAFAHRFETGLDCVRSGEKITTPEMLHLFQRCGDQLSDQVAYARDGVPGESEQADALCEQLSRIAGATELIVDAPEADFTPATLDFSDFTAGLDALASGDMPEVETPSVAYYSFSARSELFTSGNEPAHLFSALERTADLGVVADITQIPPLNDIDVTSCDITWRLEIGGGADRQMVFDVFEFVLDHADLNEIEGDASAAPLAIGGDALLADPSPDKTALPETELAATPEACSAEHQSTPVPNAQPSQPEPVPSQQDIAQPKAKANPTIRVDLDRVDKLINLVGELVIKEAMLSQSVSALNLPSENQVSSALESLKQLANEIQEGVMAIRAQPIKPIFQRMARVVRDASIATGKPVNFKTRGETTEVDKTVLERLVDPLTHMIRNAVDHGLEDPAEREATTKERDGLVTLSASHRSGRVIIEVSDDGSGIDRAKVRSIAENKGLISPDTPLTDGEIDSLLFMPGFSSKAEVSELSGRGVGLDVARSEIQSLGGKLTINATPGHGTTFSISLPLTLAVLEGMVIDVAGQTMIVPITMIQETVQPEVAQVHAVGTSDHVLATRNGLIPITDLAQHFGYRDRQRSFENKTLLVIETENRHQHALLIDGIRDQRQVVIKSLETNYQSVDGIAAATILGDGRIALIIDPDSITSKVRRLRQIAPHNSICST